jgi:hypothetical protein
VAILALGTPAFVILSVLLLFALSVVVTYTFSLVRHAKSLAADAKRAGERLSEAAGDVEQQVQAMAEKTGDLGQRPRGSGRGRRV